MSAAPLRILMVASEATPWIKTGGLADAVAGLAAALVALGQDVRLLLPAYAAGPGQLAGDPERGLMPAAQQDTGVPTWFCRLPGLGEPAANPYLDERGQERGDNGHRFGRFSRFAARVAAGQAGEDWRPDVVHCHDWQTGLVPVHMMRQRIPAASIFTIHNLSYRGLFPAALLAELGLPAWLWHADALEFHGQLSLIKGGLVFADRLSTVSPSYAREILQPAHGQGLDGLLSHRQQQLTGILNGIDEAAWNPADDPALAASYSAEKLAGKARCKTALQGELGLDRAGGRPLLGVVSRLVPQKGIDLILDILPQLLARGCQLAVLGSGLSELEQRLSVAAAAHPGQIGLRLGFDEGLAHRIEAGADLFLMPSRFEPCGLNQMYSQRYGTPPVVHATGGLADSVVDATPATLKRGSASGFATAQASAEALLAAIDRALQLREDPRQWRRLQRAAMRRDFSWAARAGEYLTLYREALAARGGATDLDQ